MNDIAAGRSSSRRLKRRSEEEHKDSPPVTNYSSSDESPKGRKLRKLPSLEDLERSPTSPQGRPTSTPRLKALGDRLTVSLFEKSAEDEPHSEYDSLIYDQERKTQARSLLGLRESRRRSSECMFKCPTCKKQFKYLSNLKSHINIVHKNLYSEAKVSVTPSNAQTSQSKARSYQCEVCLKKFKYASNLKTHRKVHSSLK